MTLLIDEDDPQKTTMTDAKN